MFQISDFSKLSNTEVNQQVLALRMQERELQVDLLLFLAELERRDIHLTKGCSSLFSYLTKVLGYSESSASRRVRVARLLKAHPACIEMLRLGEVTLVTLSLVSGVITPENELELLGEIKGKSQAEVEEFVAARKSPESRARKESIRPVRNFEKRAAVESSPSLFTTKPSEQKQNGQKPSAQKPSESFCNHSECLLLPISLR